MHQVWHGEEGLGVSRGVGSYWCEACRRTFGGREAFRQAHFGRCLPARELRKRGFRQRDDGTWTRSYDPRLPRQLRLFRVGRPRRKAGRSAGVAAKPFWVALRTTTQASESGAQEAA